jgi:hypothetical protein
MILKSFGCSFIFGTDLDDSKKILITQNKPVPSEFTWPALLAKDLGYQYKCFASPGSGNFKILEKTLTQSANGENSIFVVGWSFIDRYDYLVNNYDYKEHWDPIDNSFWSTINPNDSRSTSESYYRDLHSQFCDKLKSLTYIKCAIDTLNQKNIPFIMTYIDDLIFETQWHTSPAIIDLQNYIQPYLTQFDGKNFLEFSKQKGFLISETLHPLEAAHQAGVELIKSYKLI